jgi:hypothetical protein
MTFPSDAWFEAMVARAAENADTLRDLGIANYRLILETMDGDTARHFGLVLDGYDVEYAGELTDDAAATAFEADATLTGPLLTWQEMIDNISEHGGADLQHTLNALSIAEIPMRVFSDDPMGRDKFYRYNETLQEIFDGTAKVVAVT